MNIIKKEEIIKHQYYPPSSCDYYVVGQLVYPNLHPNQINPIHAMHVEKYVMKLLKKKKILNIIKPLKEHLKEGLLEEP